MSRVVFTIVGVAVALGSGCATLGPVAGSIGSGGLQPAGVALLDDAFTSFRPEVWNADSGDWAVEEQTLLATGSGLCTTQAADWDRYALALRFQTEQPGKNAWDVAWIYFKYLDENNFYSLLLQTTGALEVYKTTQGVRTYLGAHTTTLSPLAWNACRITVAGMRIAVEVNGTPCFKIVDAEPFGAGRIGLRSLGAVKCRFADVSVMAVGDPPAPRPAKPPRRTTAASRELNAAGNAIELALANQVRCRFVRDATQWRIAAFEVWSDAAAAWEPTYAPCNGEFLVLDKSPVFGPQASGAFADWCERLHGEGVDGYRFSGSTALGSVRLDWEADYFFRQDDALPMLHCEITYRPDRDANLGHLPKVALRTVETSATVSGSMAHIMSYGFSPKPILIERGYPAVWMRSDLGSSAHNCLLLAEVAQTAGEGRYFIYNRSESAPFFTYWVLGSMAGGHDEHFWSWRQPRATGTYPEETFLDAEKEYRLTYGLVFGSGYSDLDFYRLYWARMVDAVCPMEQVEFWATNWEECGKGLVEEEKDLETPGDKYVDGYGYYPSPRKCTTSHPAGAGDVVAWWGSVGIIQGALYYSWATADTDSFGFYADRLRNMNLPQWQASGVDGWFGEFWRRDAGYPDWASMWGTLDGGAYDLYHCYRITRDPTYLKVFLGIVDHVRTHLLSTDNTLGEHRIAKADDWYYFTPESSFTKAEKVPKGEDPGDYPGSLAVYATLCLLAYAETADPAYRDSAFACIDHVNSFLGNAQKMWTLGRITKPNGFAFACLANVRRYELSRDERYLDFAEHWLYLLLTMYHLRNENGDELGLAHAAGMGEFDYVCVATLETVKPLVVAANLLKYRLNPALLRYLAIADRRHLVVFPRNHPEGTYPYRFIPFEQVPERRSFCTYMAGTTLNENLMLHGLHAVSDPEVTAVCLDAAAGGLDLREARHLVLFNPLLIPKKVRLTVKGLNPGAYAVTTGEAVPEQMSRQALAAAGIPMALAPKTGTRVVIRR